MRSILPALLLVALSIPANPARCEVLGTVMLTLDGEEQTWYVLEPGGDMLPNALWLAMGPDRGALSIVAYRNPELEFVADEKTRSPLPAADAAALVISIGFPIDAKEKTYTLPANRGEGPAVVMLLGNWSNPLDHYALGEGPGEIRLTEIDVKAGAPSSFVGTFSGTMQKESETSRTIEGGRFELRDVPFVKRP